MDILKEAIRISSSISKDSTLEWLPPAEGTESKSEAIVYNVLVKNTRGYIERISNQINGCYDRGWFDACAVMIRRLIETLLIEVFESKSIENKIKKNGDYIFLKDMINVALSETSLNLSRNAKNALPKLKDVGDKSAHSRRFLALRQDIDDIKPDLRIIIQELLIISGIKK
jgi:hypothetical protein